MLSIAQHYCFLLFLSLFPTFFSNTSVASCSDRSSRGFPNEKRKKAAESGFGWKNKPILTAEEWYLHVGGAEGEGGGGGDGAELQVVRMEDE